MSPSEIKNLLFLEVICPSEDEEYPHRFNIPSDLHDELLKEFKEDGVLAKIFEKIPTETDEEQQWKKRLVDLARELDKID
jgi:hypothetical protein